MIIGKVYCAFSGTGKSFLSVKSNGLIVDADASNFSEIDFLDRYVAYIKRKVNEGTTVLISTGKIGYNHYELSGALLSAGIECSLVYPDISLKDEYVQRFKDRGNTEDFIEAISDNWDVWIRELMDNDKHEHIVLGYDQYLSDHIDM